MFPEDLETNCLEAEQVSLEIILKRLLQAAKKIIPTISQHHSNPVTKVNSGFLF